MLKLLTCLSLTLHLAQGASKVYTGFNYGAFWSVESNAKQTNDFLDGFNIAKNLSTDISFNSARLFTCIEAGTKNESSSALDAAVQSKTNLLLGFWITPTKRGDSNDDLVTNELTALGKGFQKHGQALADLIIGLSVGNEDVFRWEATTQSGVDAGSVASTINSVKNSIATSPFANYMANKPIGHVDTAQYAVVDNADFIGMTAYPYWNNESISAANASFHGSLKDVEQRAGNRPVWIAEMGWPFSGPQRSTAIANAANMQQFWTQVGCSVFGKYNTFWFELLVDSTPDQPDWGLVDAKSRQPRIKDLKCGAQSVGSAPASSSVVLLSKTATSGTIASQSGGYNHSTSSSKAVSTKTPLLALPSSSLLKSTKTIHTNITVYVTVVPPAPTPTAADTSSSLPLSKATTTVHKLVTVTVPYNASAAAFSSTTKHPNTTTKLQLVTVDLTTVIYPHSSSPASVTPSNHTTTPLPSPQPTTTTTVRKVVTVELTTTVYGNHNSNSSSNSSHPPVSGWTSTSMFPASSLPEYPSTTVSESNTVPAAVPTVPTVNISGFRWPQAVE